MSGGTLRVGVVGVGEMGRPVVDRLLAAGHEVHAFVRRPSLRDELGAAGVRIADSVASLGACDVVMLYLYSDEQVQQVAVEDGLIDAMSAGSVLVLNTTGSPATARRLAALAAARGVGVVDAPGSGSPADIAAGRLSLFVGGADTHVQRCLPVFQSYCLQITYLGPVGAGQLAKLLNNLLFGAHVLTALEVSRLATEAGMNEVQFATMLHTCSGQSYSLDLVARLNGAATLLAGAGKFIHKDVALARELAADIGLDLGALDDLTRVVMDRTRPAEEAH